MLRRILGILQVPTSTVWLVEPLAEHQRDGANEGPESIGDPAKDLARIPAADRERAANLVV